MVKADIVSALCEKGYYKNQANDVVWTKCSKSSETRWFVGNRYSSEVSEPLR